MMTTTTKTTMISLFDDDDDERIDDDDENDDEYVADDDTKEDTTTSKRKGADTHRPILVLVYKYVGILKIVLAQVFHMGWREASKKRDNDTAHETVIVDGMDLLKNYRNIHETDNFSNIY